MEPIKANIGTSDNLANLKNWQDMFGELAKGYIDPAEPRKLAPGQSWGAGIGKLVHKYAFDMPASIVVNAAKLFDKGSKDPLSVAPLEYTASVVDALLTATPGGGTGVANIGKRDALRQLGRSGANLAKYLGKKREQNYIDNLVLSSEAKDMAKHDTKNYFSRVKESLKAANTLPQKEFDRIDSLKWDRAFDTEYGYHMSSDRSVVLTDNLVRASRTKETSDALFHEMTHARQYNPDKSLSEMVKARALRKASDEWPTYRIRPIEQLARETARSVVEDGFSFEEAYRKNLDLYLRTAKANKNADVASSWEPYQGQWFKLAPHLREGLELAKKVPTAKKQISRLSKIAAKADEIEQNLLAKPIAAIENKKYRDLMEKARRIRGRANRRQVPYYQILQEFGIE